MIFLICSSENWAKSLPSSLRASLMLMMLDSVSVLSGSSWSNGKLLCFLILPFAVIARRRGAVAPSGPPDAV